MREITFGVVFDEDDLSYHVATFEDGELIGTYAKGFDAEEDAKEAAEAVAVEVACKVLVAETEASLAGGGS